MSSGDVDTGETSSSPSLLPETPHRARAERFESESTLRVEVFDNMSVMNIYTTSKATADFHQFITNWLTGRPAVPPSTSAGAGSVEDLLVASVVLPEDELQRQRFVNFFSPEVIYFSKLDSSIDMV